MDMVMRQCEQHAQARDRAEQQRTRAEWEAVMEASYAAADYVAHHITAVCETGRVPWEKMIKVKYAFRYTNTIE